jgi:putative transposase
MGRKRHRAEEIIGHLREAEVELSKGQSVAQICKWIGITEQTY